MNPGAQPYGDTTGGDNLPVVGNRSGLPRGGAGETEEAGAIGIPGGGYTVSATSEHGPLGGWVADPHGPGVKPLQTGSIALGKNRISLDANMAGHTLPMVVQFEFHPEPDGSTPDEGLRIDLYQRHGGR
jgi:hypothetical protein